MGYRSALGAVLADAELAMGRRAWVADALEVAGVRGEAVQA